MKCWNKLLAVASLLACVVPCAAGAQLVYPVGDRLVRPTKIAATNGYAIVAGYKAGYPQHTGVDLADGTEGGEVRAIYDGTIVYLQRKTTGWGNMLRIRHTLPDNTVVYSQYGHLKDDSITMKGVGGSVVTGEPIGQIDCTGNTFSTTTPPTLCESNGKQGPHLHFEIKRQDSNGCGYIPSSIPSCASEQFADFVDPLQFIADRLLAPFYTNDFEGAVGPEWSRTTTSATPTGGRRFLGEFANDTASLTLSALPAHGEVRLSFDLFVLKSWDGNSTVHGPDEWDLSVDGGPTLLHTTFNNCHRVTSVDGQSYPGSFPGASNPCGAGAAEEDSLGYVFNDGMGADPMDAVYKITRTFPHSGTSLILNFSAVLRVNSAISDESWGLDNVSVELLP